MSYLLNHFDTIFFRLLEHLWVSILSVLVALIIALPVAWILFEQQRLKNLVLGTLGVVYTIPSIALIIFLVPLFGLNKTSVFIALVIYSQIPLIRNILAGLENIAHDIREAAIGLGMNRWQLAWKIELPLAMPLILAGIRIALVVVISIASIGAKFGAGGLGVLLFEGIGQYRMDKLWIGTILIGGMAWGFYSGLKRLEQHLLVLNQTS